MKIIEHTEEPKIGNRVLIRCGASYIDMGVIKYVRECFAGGKSAEECQRIHNCNRLRYKLDSTITYCWSSDRGFH